MTFEAMLEATHPSAWVEFELGPALRRGFPRELSLPIAVTSIARVSSAPFARRTGGCPASRSFSLSSAGRGAPCMRFSNYPVWYQRIEERLSLSQFLDWTFVSCITGLRKPDPAAYTHVLNELGVAGRTVRVRRRSCWQLRSRTAGRDWFRAVRGGWPLARVVARRRGLVATPSGPSSTSVRNSAG